MAVWLAFVFAVGAILLILQDAFEVMLLPRRVQRRVRIVRYYFRSTWTMWRAFARRLPEGARREEVLSLYGALSMVVLFFIWAALLVGAFGVLQWAVQTLAGMRRTLGEELYLSGATFFTLGYGDVLPRTPAARAVAVLEAGMGLGFLAVVIGYLPVLYQQFSAREAHVIQLDARAGSPPTASALICRHVEAGRLDRLDAFLEPWERWCAELLESHLTYPMLAFYRSQHDNHSWLGALAAVMDACALVLVGVGETSPLQARMTFATARHVVVEMNRALHVAPAGEPLERLSPEGFAELERLFGEARLTWTGGREVEETLAALRATYEPLLQSLADHLLAPLPPWIADAREGSDHWEQGRRGLLAGRLVGDLAEREPDAPPNAMPHELTLARRLRARLRRDG